MFLDVLTVLLRVSQFERYEHVSPVVQQASGHENKRFFSEMLAQLTNKMDSKNEGYLFDFITQYQN